MFVYRAEFFAMKPGIVLLVLGLFISLPLSFGTITIGSINFNLYWMLLGVTLAVLGLQSFYFGCLAQVLCDYTDAARFRWTRIFPYTRMVVASIVLFLLGFGLAVGLAVYYLTHSFVLPPAGAVVDHLGVTGSLLMIMGFQSFCFTLLLNATGVRYGLRQTRQGLERGRSR